MMAAGWDSRHLRFTGRLVLGSSGGHCVPRGKTSLDGWCESCYFTHIQLLVPVLDINTKNLNKKCLRESATVR